MVILVDFGLVRGSAKKICPTWVGTRWDGKFPRGTENFPVPPFSRQVGRKSPRPTFLEHGGTDFPAALSVRLPTLGRPPGPPRPSLHHWTFNIEGACGAHPTEGTTYHLVLKWN